MGDTVAQTRFENVSKLFMIYCSQEVLDLEKKKTTQVLKKQRLRTRKLKILYMVGLTARVDSSKDEQKDDAKKFDVNDLHGEEVFVEKEVADKEVNDEVQKVVEDINTAKLIIDVAQVSVASEVNVAGEVNAASIATIVNVDKGKGIMVEKPVKLKRKDQIRLDEEANLKEKRKFFTAKRAEEKRNKPPTQAQQRKTMCTYLKNVERKKLKDLKNKSFDSIQKMFNRTFKRVNTFVDFITELVEGSSKRAREELTQESAKKKKIDDDKETAELKKLIEIIPNEEEVAIDAIPLAIKSLKIID
nr:hypothetical protein [Tanacetum cinerariifolium]